MQSFGKMSQRTNEVRPIDQAVYVFFFVVLFSFSSPRTNLLILKVVQYVEILRIFTRVFSATRVTKSSQRKHFHIAISPLKSTESMSSVSLSER